jgi:prophage maintenance system killer protein
MKAKNQNLVKEDIEIYRAENKKLFLEVRVEEDTIWLTQKQISELFQKDIRTINEHTKNIFKEGELDSDSTIRKFRIVQKEGNREVFRKVGFYNLDVIISVGYRVKSQQGTNFRIWATKVLKEHLLRKTSLINYKEKNLSSVVRLIGQVSAAYDLNKDEVLGLIKVISDYSYALELLDQFDHQKLKLGKTETKEEYRINYEDAIDLITTLKTKFGGSSFFGREKDQSFHSTLNTIYQTFNRKELYPGVEEKAANLLYLAIKNHSFIDGNKRIAAALFIMYLARNNFLYRISGEKRIADNALVALCLMIAESNPKEKDTMIKVVVNLINKNN